jgi:hypothetical protein
MDMRMFFLLKSLSHIVCHTFQVMKNINRSNQIIQNIRSIKKGRPLGMNQFKWFNLKGQIQNKIKFSYLGGQGVSLI